METLKQANYANKADFVKNRTVCNNGIFEYTSVTPNILKN